MVHYLESCNCFRKRLFTEQILTEILITEWKMYFKIMINQHTECSQNLLLKPHMIIESTQDVMQLLMIGIEILSCQVNSNFSRS